MLSQVLLDQIMYCNIEVVCLLQKICCLTESLCYDGIQSSVGAGDGVCTTYHTELELITGESKR